MSKIILKGLKIAVATKARKTNEYVKQGKITQAIVIESNGYYKVSIDSDNNGTDEVILDFTPRSFEVVDKETVFLKNTTIRIIRDKWKAKFHPGSTEQYVPFAPNWIVKGYIVKQNGQRLFDFKTLVGIADYNINNNTFEE